MNRRIIAGLILALALSLGLLGVASAHAKLVSSDPAAGAKLTKAPSKVSLVFSEEISDKQADSNFTVTDETGAVVGNGKLDTTDLDHKTQSGTLKAGLGDGVYTVKWNALTTDDNGHTEGSFTFGVNKDPGPQPTAAPEPTEMPEASPTAAAGGAAQPTASAGGAAQPAPTTAANSANLPQTGDGTPDQGIAILFAAGLALAGGLALRRRHAGR